MDSLVLISALCFGFLINEASCDTYCPYYNESGAVIPYTCAITCCSSSTASSMSAACCNTNTLITKFLQENWIALTIAGSLFLLIVLICCGLACPLCIRFCCCKRKFESKGKVGVAPDDVATAPQEVAPVPRTNESLFAAKSQQTSQTSLDGATRHRAQQANVFKIEDEPDAAMPVLPGSKLPARSDALELTGLETPPEYSES